MQHFDELDKIYRISEKQEINKYLEIGKTPKQYYSEQEARGVKTSLDTQSSSKDSSAQTSTTSSTQSLRETLMQKTEEG